MLIVLSSNDEQIPGLADPPAALPVEDPLPDEEQLLRMGWVMKMLQEDPIAEEKATAAQQKKREARLKRNERRQERRLERARQKQCEHDSEGSDGDGRLIDGVRWKYLFALELD